MFAVAIDGPAGAGKSSVAKAAGPGTLWAVSHSPLENPRKCGIMQGPRRAGVGFLARKGLTP